MAQHLRRYRVAASRSRRLGMCRLRRVRRVAGLAAAAQVRGSADSRSLSRPAGPAGIAAPVLAASSMPSTAALSVPSPPITTARATSPARSPGPFPISLRPQSTVSARDSLICKHAFHPCGSRAAAIARARAGPAPRPDQGLASKATRMRRGSLTMCAILPTAKPPSC